MMAAQRVCARATVRRREGMQPKTPCATARHPLTAGRGGVGASAAPCQGRTRRRRVWRAHRLCDLAGDARRFGLFRRRPKTGVVWAATTSGGRSASRAQLFGCMSAHAFVAGPNTRQASRWGAPAAPCRGRRRVWGGRRRRCRRRRRQFGGGGGRRWRRRALPLLPRQGPPRRGRPLSVSLVPTQLGGGAAPVTGTAAADATPD